MPTVTLITIRTLHKDTRVGQTLSEYFAADVVQPDALADVPPGLLDYRIAIHVGQQAEAEAFRVARIGKTIYRYARLRRVKRLTHSRV